MAGQGAYPIVSDWPELDALSDRQEFGHVDQSLRAVSENFFFGASMPKLNEKTELAPTRAYAPGLNQVSDVDIPVNGLHTRIFFTRDGLPDLGPTTPVVEVRQWYSFDGGQTWEFGGASTYTGGVHLDRNGVPYPESYLGIKKLPGQATANRKIRIEIIPLVPLTTKISTEIND